MAAVDAKVPVPKDKQSATKPAEGTVPLRATTAGNPTLPATAVSKEIVRNRDTKLPNGLSYTTAVSATAALVSSSLLLLFEEYIRRLVSKRVGIPRREAKHAWRMLLSVQLLARIALL